MDALLALFFALGLTAFLVGLTTLAYFPLSVVYEARRRRPPAGLDDALVSVVVPAFNEEASIAACVESVLASDHRRLELIVVDDGSTDRTAEVLVPFGSDPRFRLLRQPNQGKPTALNAGVEAARGDVIVFFDADVLVRPDTVSELLRGFRSSKVGAVSGNDAPHNVRGPRTQLAVLQTHVGSGGAVPRGRSRTPSRTRGLSSISDGSRTRSVGGRWRRRWRPGFRRRGRRPRPPRG